MKRKTVDGKKNLWILFIGLGLVGLAVCGLFMLRINVLRAAAQMETKTYLSEISQRIADTLNSRIDASFRALETTAQVYATMEEGEETEQYLNEIARQYGFRRMAVTRPGGALETTDGYTIPSDGLSGAQAAMERGEKSANATISPITGEKIVVYDVPMWSGEKIVGVLSAVSDMSTLRDSLGVESFGGEGYSRIVNGAGEDIATTVNHLSGMESENFFIQVERGSVNEAYSLDTVRADMAARRMGSLDYSLEDGQRRLMCYVPLEVSDWYLLAVVPYGIVERSVRDYTRIAEQVDVFIVLLFLALIAVIVIVFRRGQKQAERLAFVDSVTGGDNRTAFEWEVERLLSVAVPESYALVSMDLQGFKLINETFGSEAGDKTLLHVYNNITKQLKEGEAAGRIGGDVFSMLLKYTTRKDMERRMELLSEEINHFNLDREEKYYLPMHQGVYVVDDPALDVITVQDRANVARKSDKQTRLGRLNTCVFYDDLYRRRMSREKEIDNRMETALENGEFIIYLQPKVELRWNTVAGAEALVRWQDPERGLVLPGEFIPQFERSGFVVRLDRYVFEEVCKLQRRWLDGGRKPVVVSLNVSRGNLADPDFLDEYVRIKEKYRIPDGLLELEITETLFLENEQLLLGLMERIRASGFLCALDDFGSGYSTLSLLRIIPADVIKLDRVFFMGAEHDPRGEHVVQSILELAHRLKIQTVCEGVERPNQLNSLRRFQCDMVQGHVFSEAVSVERFEELAFSGRPMEMRSESMSSC